MFFDDRRNRTLLLSFLVVSGVLESMYFAFASEGMYSAVYPSLVDLLIVVGAALLCQFIDFRRKMGIVFNMAGALLMSVFATLLAEWVQVGHEQWYLVAQSGTILYHFGRYTLLAVLPIVITGFIKKGKSLADGEQLTGAVGALSAMLTLFCFGESAFYAFAIAVAAFISGWFILQLDGGGMNLKLPFAILMTAAYFAEWVLFFSHNGGAILVQEAACAVSLLMSGVGLVAALCHKRFGLYLYEYCALHLAFGYVAAYLRGDTGSEFLFGLLPLLLVFAVGFAADRAGSEQAHLLGKQGNKKKK